jgi:type II secretory pathway predicted ATPase ExeA
MGRINQIARATDAELDAYLDELGWPANPFAGAAGLDEYVLPGNEEIADVISHLTSYTGPVLIHSRYSGVGKTTLLRMLLEDLGEESRTIIIPEHNVTPYELVAIVADSIGIGKSSSTKMTEQKIREYVDDYDGPPILLGIDEFGLNDPDTLHTVQFLNDLGPFRVLLTGMSSQWDAISGLGSDGKAFQRRVSYQLELEPFERDQTDELVRRRIASAVDQDVEAVTIHPFDAATLDAVHERAKGVPAVATAACADLVGLQAFYAANSQGVVIEPDVVDDVEFADPEVE